MNWVNCYGSLGERTGNYCIHFPCSFTIFSNVIPASTYGRKLWVWELAQVWKLGKASWLLYWRSDFSLLLTHLWSLWSYKLRIILIWLSICFPLGALCFISIFICQKVFLSSLLLSSLTHWFFRSVSFSRHICMNFPVFLFVIDFWFHTTLVRKDT